MKKTVLTLGLISGAMSADRIGCELGEILGYNEATVLRGLKSCGAPSG